jgi:predicted RNA binding protein YcfA (HicA-like mRNA interferase family)
MATDLYRKLTAILRDNACEKVREGKGSHEIWYSPVTSKNIPVPVTIKSRHTSNAILKQAGIATKL